MRTYDLGQPVFDCSLLPLKRRRRQEQLRPPQGRLSQLCEPLSAQVICFNFLDSGLSLQI